MSKNGKRIVRKKRSNKWHELVISTPSNNFYIGIPEKDKTKMKDIAASIDYAVSTYKIKISLI